MAEAKKNKMKVNDLNLSFFLKVKGPLGKAKAKL